MPAGWVSAMPGPDANGIKAPADKVGPSNFRPEFLEVQTARSSGLATA
jgi:hypothetical protein